jgi:hypothetical protein
MDHSSLCCNSRMKDCFYAHKYHYEHVMCHLLNKNTLTSVKTINITLLFFIAFHYNKISLLQI